MQQCLGARRKLDDFSGDFFLPQLMLCS